MRRVLYCCFLLGCNLIFLKDVTHVKFHQTTHGYLTITYDMKIKFISCKNLILKIFLQSLLKFYKWNFTRSDRIQLLVQNLTLFNKIFALNVTKSFLEKCRINLLYTKRFWLIFMKKRLWLEKAAFLFFIWLFDAPISKRTSRFPSFTFFSYLLSSRLKKAVSTGSFGGIVVSVLAFFFKDPSSNPADYWIIFCTVLLVKTQINSNEARLATLRKWNAVSTLISHREVFFSPTSSV